MLPFSAGDATLFSRNVGSKAGEQSYFQIVKLLIKIVQVKKDKQKYVVKKIVCSKKKFGKENLG